MVIFNSYVSLPEGTMNHRKFPADVENTGSWFPGFSEKIEVGSHRSTWTLLVPKIFGVCKDIYILDVYNISICYTILIYIYIHIHIYIYIQYI